MKILLKGISFGILHSKYFHCKKRSKLLQLSWKLSAAIAAAYDKLQQFWCTSTVLLLLFFALICTFSLGCDENGQPQEISKADFNSSCPYSGPPPDEKIATFYDFHEIKSGGEEIRYEPGAELLFRCVDIGKYYKCKALDRLIDRMWWCSYQTTLRSLI